MEKIKIGLTYDLRDEYLKMGFSEEETAEFDKEDTIIGIENALIELGYQTERIGNIKNLVSELSIGKKWDIVFNICEGLYGIGRESQVPCLLDAFNIPYVFSDPLVLALSLHKGMIKKVLRYYNIPTPDFFVVKNITDVEKINLEFPLFAKPVAEGTGKGITDKSLINNKQELIEVCSYLLEKFHQPVLIEKYLSGREFTVGIIGTGENARCVGVMEIVLNSKAEKNVYSYTNKDQYLDRVTYNIIEGKIARECEKVALDAWIAIGAEDGGRVDVRYDSAGIANFVEVNPLAGLNPTHSDLCIMSRIQGYSYSQLIGWIMESAIKKIRKCKKL
ncbi:MAG: D-alanine--D-alanine ligase [Bacteroidota bacterium]